MTSPLAYREQFRSAHRADETGLLAALVAGAAIDQQTRTKIVGRAVDLIEAVRADARPGLMEAFLSEYGLSSEEGVALMCLAEALLRVPDAQTIDRLIEDKIAPSSWSDHLGHSSSPLVNASTWALMLTGKVLDEDESVGIAHILRGAIKRLGEPVIRSAVTQAMKELGRQFVLGQTIEAALKESASYVKAGFTFSYDMLGEAALTAADARKYFEAYKSAITAIAPFSGGTDVRENPGISIKLSALHPRYEFAKRERVLTELTARVLELAIAAKDANMGLNIDAEEAERLDLSLDLIERVLSSEALKGWDGFGIVAQAYGKRAAPLIDWVYHLAESLERHLMVRLVKGAYWDKEIKQAQLEGVSDFPVFTRKAATDTSFICCAKKLLTMTDRLYPQFATHNAHTMAAILELAPDRQLFEFQRLYGMGEALHRIVLTGEGTRARIYAPVGRHRDLLAYLVRRLLENGANASFVHQIVDPKIPALEIARDPFSLIDQPTDQRRTAITWPHALYAPHRVNSKGFDLADPVDLTSIDHARNPFKNRQWAAEPLLAVPCSGGTPTDIFNPADRSDRVGSVIEATEVDVRAAIGTAKDWSTSPAADRARILGRASDLYEQNFAEFFALLAREAGKNLPDAVAEFREAVDFLRYYASECENLSGVSPRGLVAAISPWNFPLAIFTGQIAAGLAAGNGVLAKCAEATPLTAFLAVRLLHKAGVPREILQFLPGAGGRIGAALTRDPRVGGVCFTGSLPTAQAINRAMARYLDPGACLIAETGGINAMIVDSTALPEQAVKAVLESAFRSAGQRCSALRILYVQEDVAGRFLDMLFGAMDELAVGDPWQLPTDVGPVISEAARSEIQDYIDRANAEGRLMKQLAAPRGGTFVAPAVIKVAGIGDIEKEIFGPVLHIATFGPDEISKIVENINRSGYGLTFGLQTRIDDRAEHIATRLKVGNIYINRNQIGAIVGVQPFGGEGLSGTGPKAGGPHYLPRLLAADPATTFPRRGELVKLENVQAALDAFADSEYRRLETLELPGPTGESNRLSLYPRGTILCLGPEPEQAREQARIARSRGCAAVIIAPDTDEKTLAGDLDRNILTRLKGIDGVALWSDEADQRAAREALAARSGPLIPLFTERNFAHRCVIERHICIDTTAAGGNPALLARTG